MASDRCAALNTAFVTLLLRVANADGEVQAHTVELSVPEFNVRARARHRIAPHGTALNPRRTVCPRRGSVALELT